MWLEESPPLGRGPYARPGNWFCGPWEPAWSRGSPGPGKHTLQALVFQQRLSFLHRCWWEAHARMPHHQPSAPYQL